MKRLRFICANGEEEVFAQEGDTVMQAAKAHDIVGIDADCGGSMACGTCHVIVVDALTAMFPPPTQVEAEMLEYVPAPHPDARLSCQLRIADCADGMVFRVPDAQR